jgi:transcriptional regulator with XRE-family HTH domain
VVVTEQELRENFGAVLRYERTRCGLTQLDVSEELGVGREVVSRWESGRLFPTPRHVVALLSLFSVEAFHLGGVNPPSTLFTVNIPGE